MALRAFTDVSGVDWEVWEVHPTLTERRTLATRRLVPRASYDRRILDVPRYALAQGLDHGWLAFRSSVERRRRSAIPERWEELSTAGLCSLLADSRLSGPVRRLAD